MITIIPRMPEMLSSTRSLIGWLKLNSMPGIASSALRMASTTCSLLRPVFHSSSGFIITKVSAWLGASSSVPSSGWPCSVSASDTSGKLSSTARVSRSMRWPSSSEMAEGMVTVT